VIRIKDRVANQLYSSGNSIVYTLGMQGDTLTGPIEKNGRSVKCIYLNTEYVLGGCELYDWDILYPYKEVWKWNAEGRTGGAVAKTDTIKMQRNAIKGLFGRMLGRDLKRWL
jgi:hypothetical protein